MGTSARSARRSPDPGPHEAPGSAAEERRQRQPLSIVSACPRPGILAISVTPGFRFCRLYEALAIDHGTVLSSSTLASVQGLRLAGRGLEEGLPEAGTA